MRLLNTHSLVFTMYASGGYPGTDGNWVYPTPTTQTVKGSLQSFKKGTETLILPDGYRTQDVKVFLTKTNIPTLEESSSKKAATTIIDGRTYVVHDREDNTGFSLAADHYKLYLVREPQDDGEGW